MAIDLTDWPDYERWSEDQIDAYEIALGELQQGKLDDLASYLRKGYPLGGGMAEILASAIDRADDARFYLQVVATKPGGRIAPFDWQKHEEDMLLGARAHVRLLDAPRAHGGRIKEEVAKERKVPVSRVSRALTYFRKHAFDRNSTLPIVDPISAAQALGKAMREIEQGNPRKD